MQIKKNQKKCYTRKNKWKLWKRIAYEFAFSPSWELAEMNITTRKMHINVLADAAAISLFRFRQQKSEINESRQSEIYREYIKSKLGS